MTESEARNLAEVALRTTRERGCDCEPHIGIDAEGPAGCPVAHVHHGPACRLGASMRADKEYTMVLGSPGGAELN